MKLEFNLCKILILLTILLVVLTTISVFIKTILYSAIVLTLMTISLITIEMASKVMKMFNADVFIKFSKTKPWISTKVVVEELKGDL